MMGAPGRRLQSQGCRFLRGLLAGACKFIVFKLNRNDRSMDIPYREYEEVNSSLRNIKKMFFPNEIKDFKGSNFGR